MSAWKTYVRATPRAPNDPAQYDDLAHTWWEPKGPLGMLHALAAARAEEIPAAARAGSILVDLGCGGGLLAPHVASKGYVHVGIDLTRSALDVAAAHGVIPIAADVASLPIGDGAADVVVLGEILEHVRDHAAVVAEACRILRPGGALILDTIANTWIARLIAVEIAERLPGGAPKGIHDADLFVDRQLLIESCAANGVTISLRGIRPTLTSMIGFWRDSRPTMTFVSTPLTSVLFQGTGTKAL